MFQIGAQQHPSILGGHLCDRIGMAWGRAGYRPSVPTDDASDRVPAQLRLAAAWSWRLILVGLVAAAVLWLLLRLATVVLPVVLALFIASVLEPLAARLRRHGWPRALAATVVFVTALVLAAGACWWLATAVGDEFGGIGDRLDDAIEDGRQWLVDGPLGLQQERVDSLERNIRDGLSSTGGGISQTVIGGARLTVEVLAGFVLMLFALFFVLKDGESIGAWLIARTPEPYREDAREIGRRGTFVLRRYFVATTLTGLVDAVLIAIALVIIGVPAVAPLAALTFIGGFFPIVGATVAGLVASLVALSDGGVVDALLVLGATIVVQQVEGNLLQPLFLERQVRLHALVTVTAVGAGIVLAGIAGAFIAVPIVAFAAQIGNFYRTRDEEPATTPTSP
jgi:predicted PurR-regulated permease PerM